MCGLGVILMEELSFQENHWNSIESNDNYDGLLAEEIVLFLADLVMFSFIVYFFLLVLPNLCVCLRRCHLGHYWRKIDFVLSGWGKPAAAVWLPINQICPNSILPSSTSLLAFSSSWGRTIISSLT